MRVRGRAASRPRAGRWQSRCHWNRSCAACSRTPCRARDSRSRRIGVPRARRVRRAARGRNDTAGTALAFARAAPSGEVDVRRARVARHTVRRGGRAAPAARGAALTGSSILRGDARHPPRTIPRRLEPARRSRASQLVCRAWRGGAILRPGIEVRQSRRRRRGRRTGKSVPAGCKGCRSVPKRNARAGSMCQGGGGSACRAKLRLRPSISARSSRSVRPARPLTTPGGMSTASRVPACCGPPAAAGRWAGIVAGQWAGIVAAPHRAGGGT
jgi:hypothetical protein